MNRHLLHILIITLLATISAVAQNTTVRILFYTGTVTVKAGKNTGPATLGQQLGAKDEITIGRGGTLQLSVNGKVIKYNQAGKVKVSDAIKRAGSGENAAVANTVRTLAAASGADREKRTSQAGATRMDDSSTIIAEQKKRIQDEITTAANNELRNRTGIDDPLGKASEAARLILGEDDMIILEPRSCAISSGPIRFRWLRSPTAGGYIVSVKNYLGDEVFRRESSDTSLLWEAPSLAPDIVYTWSLIDARNSLHRTGTTFHRLSDSADAIVRTGAEDIRRELGADNPATPLVLGAYYADVGCYGEAARLFTEAAAASTQHYNEFMSRACEQYRYGMFMPEEEILAVYRGR